MFSGFIANVDTTRVQDGVHSLTVRVTDRQGLSRVIGQRNVQIFNSENNLRPFGYIDEPKRDAVLYGTNCGTIPTCRVSPCVPLDLENHITPVRGWALDLGTRADLGRISYAELMVDGARWYSTNACRFDSTLGAMVNCYGLPRFDVQRYYPTYPDAPRSGFLFTLDVGALLAIGVGSGNHVLKVRVGDQEQTFADLPNTSGIPVFFQCADETTDFASQGYIDFPKDHDFVSGDVTFAGWALDDNGGVQQVEILVDGHLMGIATYGYARPDVKAAYPTAINSANSGWRFTLDTTQLGDNRHRLTVQVVDRFGGHRSIIGSTDFYVDNPN
jgi:N-acetylmuramoyl-L-alanine amidase